MTKPPKMYMIFSPKGERQYTSLRWSAKDSKLFWTGSDLSMWKKWREAGWSCHPVTVDVKLFHKIKIPARAKVNGVKKGNGKK